MSKLAPHVLDFAEAVQEAHEKDLAYEFSSKGAKPIASVEAILHRANLLVEAIKAKKGVEEHAAYLGSALTGIFLVGDEAATDPQLELPGLVDEAVAHAPDEKPVAAKPDEKKDEKKEEGGKKVVQMPTKPAAAKKDEKPADDGEDDDDDDDDDDGDDEEEAAAPKKGAKGSGKK